MSTSSLHADYSAITTIGSLACPCPDTVSLFDCDHSDDHFSPIDNFISNCTQINLLWISDDEVSPEFGRLLLLGYVSAVESYVRAILRSIINTDAQTATNAHSSVIPFGAALYHKKDVIAEALLEGFSFAGEDDIKKALNKFLKINNYTNDQKIIFSDYEKICQMRHCCIHRFGKLGTQNGLVLGLIKHSKALEKPLKLDKQSIEDLASWLMSFVKALNNFLFSTLLDRSCMTENEHKVDWKWQYSRDKAKFDRIYSLFASKLIGSASPSASVMYERFRQAKKR